MGGGSSKVSSSSASAAGQAGSGIQQKHSSGPNSKNKKGGGNHRLIRQNSASQPIDLHATIKFVHAAGFVDNGSSSSFPPRIGSQLAAALQTKNRAAWGQFFSALQQNAPLIELETAAASACTASSKGKSGVKAAAAVAAGVQDALNALKWALDGPLAVALESIEEEVRDDNDMVWTDMDMKDYAGRLTKCLCSGGAAPDQAQSVQTRSALVRCIQAIYNAVTAIPAEQGVRHALADDCYVSLGVCQLMRSMSPFLLEKSKSASTLLRQYREVDSLLFGDGALEDHMAVLDYVGKSLFLHLYIGQPVPIDLVLSRETVFEDLVEQLRDDKTNPLDVAQVATFRAYFRSNYGTKQVKGEKVEEGEGLGPRKEFFSLASLHLQSLWKDKQTLAGTVAVSKGDTKVTGRGTKFKGIVQPGMRLSIGQGTSDSPTNEFGIVKSVNSDTELQFEKRFQSSHEEASAWAARPAKPLFVYSKNAEAFWYNTEIKQNQANVAKYTAVGRMIAAAIADRCKLDTLLCETIFDHLLQADMASYRPTIHDLMRFDPSMGNQVMSVHKASRAALAEMIEDADMPTEVKTAQDYVAHSCCELLFGAVRWQAEALHHGFRLGTKLEWWGKCAISPVELQCIAVGSPDTTADFEFRRVFRVVEDPELQQCAPLRDTLWSIVDALDRLEKRQLLRFITGVDRLPSAGTEMIKIEMPFMAYSQEEHEQTLHKMPQAHTCDNILELPNYWQSLKALRPDASDSELVKELRSIIQEKVKMAFSLSDGFGLDTAFD